jgi:hypothetical protein
LKTGTNFFLQHFKNKIIFSFEKFVATEKGFKKFFFTLFFGCCFWIRDPGSGIRDLGSGMGKNQDPGSGLTSRIRNTGRREMYYDKVEKIKEPI